MILSPKRKLTNVGLPNNLLQAIGHVAALWAQLEYIMDSATRENLDRPEAPQIQTKLVRTFDRRADLFSDLCSKFLVRSDERRYAKEFIVAAKHLSARRNLVIHGSVSHSKQRRNGKTVYWFRRILWDKPIQFLEKRDFTVKQVEQLAAEISDQVAIAGHIEIILSASARTSRDKGS